MGDLWHLLNFPNPRHIYWSLLCPSSRWAYINQKADIMFKVGFIMCTSKSRTYNAYVQLTKHCVHQKVATMIICWLIHHKISSHFNFYFIWGSQILHLGQINMYIVCVPHQIKNYIGNFKLGTECPPICELRHSYLA